VAGGYGLLFTMQKLVSGGPWTQTPDILAQSVAAARMTYEIWLWQTLMPQVFRVGFCHGGANCLNQSPDFQWTDPATGTLYWPVPTDAGIFNCLAKANSTVMNHLFDSPVLPA
jgi:hypothetical protein